MNNWNVENVSLETNENHLKYEFWCSDYDVWVTHAISICIHGPFEATQHSLPFQTTHVMSHARDTTGCCLPSQVHYFARSLIYKKMQILGKDNRNESSVVLMCGINTKNDDFAGSFPI